MTELRQQDVSGHPRPLTLLGDGGEYLARLERLPWRVQFAWEKCGFVGGFRCNRLLADDEWASLTPPGATFADTARVDTLYSLLCAGPDANRDTSSYGVYRNGGLLAETQCRNAAISRLADQVHADVAVGSRERAFLHAGVVGIGSHAVLLPGRSHAGKSTLVRALLQAGATYLSDEFAVLDGEGWVEPYPVPLNLRRDSAALFGQLPASGWRGPQEVAALPVGMVIALDFEAPRGWRVEAMTPGETVLSLLRHAVGARHRPEAALHAAGRVSLSALGWQGTRGEAEEAAAWIMGRATQLGYLEGTP